MKKYIVVFSILCALFIDANAQQQIQLTQNIFNILSYNPGYAGSQNSINAIGTFRNQWTGFGRTETVGEDGSTTKSKALSPRLYMISLDAPVRALRGGLGLTITSDKIGAFENIAVNLGYAYQRELANGGNLGIGAQVRFDNVVLNAGDLIWGDEGDPIESEMLSSGNDFIVDCNFGVFYSKPNSFFGGVSAYNLVGTQGKNTLYKEKRSFNVHGGYQYRIPSNPKIKIIPSALIKTDLSSFQVDLNALLMYKDKFWGGLNYRINDGLGILLGLVWKDFMLGYSYDITMSSMALGGSWGSHEVVLSYSFKFEREKGRTTQRNTRYL
ncbi:MAG: type IX secretion system membrane protein PorP/SprF [Bacteroidales bacterium]|nr:type IX secretion system membrane protein PorP/SprF [Bacteroidales bacterium]MDD2205534.1 type IX secretion system membrane protein PorP/SprF [Bacteroidales bacterium]MDD3151723.1 type IX secretion system membrane protein PorP/SprF [Bacteroidales bacterium]MDD3913716.1 type IX secretion system membrane protein PorP/SprF [Bacteroidales bacterium]MDD4634646.1 type IX secretion system membrane protein PorP/SprF [Bacteroidales bacterium]